MSFDFTKLSVLGDKLETTKFSEINSYEDADDDLLPLASFIKYNTMHNENIEPNKIKFLYTSKVKKDGGRYVIGSLLQRSDIEKFVDDRYDFIVIIYYPVWKDLDGENKLIQLDKILSGIDVGTMEKPVLKKKQPDSKEFLPNLRFFGADNVLKSSDLIHLACERLVEEQKEEKKNS